MRREMQVALICAGVALVIGVFAVRTAAGTDGNLSRLVRMSATEPMAEVARSADSAFNFVPPEGHYDGVYFYSIAHDPLASGEGSSRIDFPAYRYGHPGYGWAAGFLSLGIDRWIVPAMVLVGLAGLAVAALCTSLIAAHIGRTPWAGLLVVVNPGVIYALISLTSETLAVGLLAAGALFYLRERSWVCVGMLTALALVKEPFVLIPAALAICEFTRAQGGERLRRAAPFVIPVAALGAWFVHLKAQLGIWSFTDGPENLAAPFKGWGDALKTAADMTYGGFETMQLGSASLPLLLVIGAALILGSIAALRRRGPFDLMFLGQALVIACVSSLVLLYPKDMLRNVAIPLALLPMVLVGGRTDDEEKASEVLSASTPA